MFPIQRGPSVPWSEAERAYVTYAQHFGTSQSLQRLAERGGFDVQEFVCLWMGHADQMHCKEQHSWPNFESIQLRTDLTAAQNLIAELESDLSTYAATILNMCDQLSTAKEGA